MRWWRSGQQRGGNSIEKPFDIDVDLPVPLLYLEGLDRFDGHNAGVIEEHIDPAETVDGLLDERFYWCALRHIGGKSDGLAAKAAEIS